MSTKRNTKKFKKNLKSKNQPKGSGKTIEIINSISQQKGKKYYEFIGMIGEKLSNRFNFLKTLVDNSILETTHKSIKLNNIVLTEYITFYNNEIRLILHPYRNGITVHIIEVQPKYQGKGIGREIMKMILSISNELKIPIYLIPVEMGNVSIEILRSFYHSLGFNREKDSRYWKYQPVRYLSITEKQMEYRMVG